MENELIEDEEKLRERIDNYIEERSKAQDSFSAKYNANVDPYKNKWKMFAKVFPKGNISDILNESW